MSADAPADAIFPVRNSQPAAKPAQWCTVSPANVYTPPERGYAMASCAVVSALSVAIAAAMTRPASSQVPAAAAAGAHTKKTPEPTIAETPTMLAPMRPIRRSRVPRRPSSMGSGYPRRRVRE